MQSLIPLTHDIVLIGGGHTHALVLRMWAMTPLPGARLTVINPAPTAAYSGMLPGFVAGHYGRGDLDIDLVRLARAAGARILLGRATAIDTTAKQIHVTGRPPVAYDIASIDIGITTGMPDLPGFTDHAVPAKPLDRFATRWDAFRAAPSGDMAVIGGGIAGAELALAMAHAVPAHAVHVIDRGDILSELSAKAAGTVRRAMDRHGIRIHDTTEVTGVTPSGVTLSGGSTLPAAFVVGAAAPRPQPWPAEGGLACSGGFIHVDGHLKTSDPHIFAAGDCAHMVATPRPKAGVYAVRQAPVLFANLRAMAMGRRLRRYRPQAGYLKLMSLGGKTAVAEKAGRSLSGPAMWRWKNRIDRSFMAKFSALTPMTPPAPRHVTKGAPAKPLCAGCGSKVGRGALADVLAALPAHGRGDVVPLPGDDAALLVMPGTRQVLTTDHLRAFTEDTALMTRIAAHHALGDVWSMGAAPQAATVNIVLPRMTAELQRRTLADIMAAASDVIHGAGAAIVGGHTSMGSETTIGFSITGLCNGDPVTLAGARAGDALILTKPIGSGTILAADMALRAPGGVVAACLDMLCQGQGDAARILTPRAMTDVTGFGLAGHLAGMCDASGTGAQVDLAAVPIMPGALALAEAGIRSSLWDDNRADAQVTAPITARADLMFDPQTSGGLLAAVDPGDADRQLAALRQAGFDAAIIGHMTAAPGVIFA